MKKLETLAQKTGMNANTIATELMDMNTSCEYYYINRKGETTTDITNDVEIKKGEYYDECKGCFRVTLSVEGVRQTITVYCRMYLEKWDEDAQEYQIESPEPIGWDDNMTAKKRYADKVQVVKTIWLHKSNDADIIEHLKGKQISAYVKKLIRDDMNK